MKYKTCPECGAHLDYGERCDCRGKKEDAPSAKDAPKKHRPDCDGSGTVSILSQIDDAVNRNDLPAFMDCLGIRAKEATTALKERFDLLDKSIILKCCAPESYGCVLHPDGYQILRGMFPENASGPAIPPERSRARRGDRHKLTARVMARLPEEKRRQLQLYLRLEGYSTVNDWIVSQVDQYIERMAKKYG